MIKTLANFLLSRARKFPPTCVVVHATAGGSATSSIDWLRHIGLSYNYLIEDDGTVYKAVPASRVAFHAGESVGPNGPNVNAYSVGIAFAHSNLPSEGYTEAALDACERLVADLKKQFPSLKHIVTHYGITIKPDGSFRKSDPINFEYLTRVGAGLLPWKPVYAASYAKVV